MVMCHNPDSLGRCGFCGRNIRLLDIACSPSDSAFATAAVSSDGSDGVFYLYNFKTLQLEVTPMLAMSDVIPLASAADSQRFGWWSLM